MCLQSGKQYLCHFFGHKDAEIRTKLWKSEWIPKEETIELKAGRVVGVTSFAAEEVLPSETLLKRHWSSEKPVAKRIGPVVSAASAR